MLKFGKLALLFCFLLFFASLSFPFVSYWLDQPHQHEIQTTVLNRNFTSVKLQKGQVLLVPAPRRHLMRIGQLFFDKPTLFPVGAQFRASDRHWGATYTIEAIKANGVVIGFDAEGGSSATSVRRSVGTVELGWK